MTYFLIRKLSPEIRQLMEAEAQALDVPLAEIGRSIMCAHYELDCPPLKGSWKREDAWKRPRDLQLHLHDEVWAALKQDASETGESMQRLAREALAAHYERSAVT